MSKIRVLPEILANKIAAGEIVERPASVIKELVENSLDAGARNITVEVSHGGRQLMRVQDDGEGMGADDALLAFEHHATSKLRDSEDLMAIGTLGFRGEALPSIASVSRLTLRTVEAARAEAETPLGTEIVIQGGVIRAVKSVPWARGTEVVVRDLFYNVPARKKFLKSNDTELGHISRVVTQYALAHPELHCRFVHNERTAFHYEATASLQERVYQVLGAQVAENLVTFDREREGHRVQGYASRPHEHRSHPYTQYFFVNRRLVRDRLIGHAVNRAYGPALPKGAYPVMVLLIEAPPAEIDVNVHPAKTEIRFRNANLVHELIRTALEEALLRAQPVPRLHMPQQELEAGRSPRADWRRPPVLRPVTPPVWKGHSTPPQPGTSARGEGLEPAVEIDDLSCGSQSLEYDVSGQLSDCARRPLADEKTLARAQMRVLEGSLDTGLRAVGQLAQTYILAADAEGLVLVDQHVAHERILFEQFYDQLRSRKLVAQRLLMPLTFDITRDQMLLLERHRADLAAVGFDVESFGGQTVAIRSAPASLPLTGCEIVVREILEQIEQSGFQDSLEEFQKATAARLACTAAVKANMPLTFDKMSWLLDRLTTTRFPHACPHGRPIQLRVSLKEIAQRFQRI